MKSCKAMGLKISTYYYQNTKIKRNSEDMSIVKEIEKYIELIHNGLELNAKGLRNISWDSFNQGEENGKNLLYAIINKAIRNSQFTHIEMLSEVASIAVNETNKTWWH